MEKENGKGCPVEKYRVGLGLTRMDLAKSAGLNYCAVAHCELGYLTEIPRPILKAFEPFLPDLGTTEEKLQEEWRVWRSSLGADVRRKAMKYTEVRRLHPTIDSDPRDEALSDALLERW
jgi:hypothetical protein